MASWSNPVKGRVIISSPFGWRKHPITKKRSFHNGVDIVVRAGTPVFSVFAVGVVTKVEKDPNNPWGLRVDIKHTYGFYSFYAHLSRVDVAVGQGVTKETQIGLSGNTGTLTTGAHLHFGMGLLFGSIPVNPLHYIPA